MLVDLRIGQQAAVDFDEGWCCESFVLKNYWFTLTYTAADKTCRLFRGDQHGCEMLVFPLFGIVISGRQTNTSMYRRTLQESKLIPVLRKANGDINELKKFLQ